MLIDDWLYSLALIWWEICCHPYFAPGYLSGFETCNEDIIWYDIPQVFRYDVPWASWISGFIVLIKLESCWVIISSNIFHHYLLQGLILCIIRGLEIVPQFIFFVLSTLLRFAFYFKQFLWLSIQVHESFFSMSNCNQLYPKYLFYVRHNFHFKNFSFFHIFIVSP